jgi:LPXTG-site transpeptidase (sortase) family protein
MITSRKENFLRILLRRSISIFSAVILIFTIVFVTSNTLKKVAYSDSVPLLNVAAANGSNQPINIGLPVRLKIPTIGVDASIYYIGLTQSGVMDIKKDPTQVAWYEFGPRPGNNGSAVIAGHYGWTGEKGSVFNNLHKLKKGDEIIIIDNNNRPITFVMRESRKFDPNADASSIFNSNDGKAHLNLITCDGTWQDSKQTYSDRLVVFADKE